MHSNLSLIIFTHASFEERHHLGICYLKWKIHNFSTQVFKYQEIVSVLSTFPRSKSIGFHSKKNPGGKMLARCCNSGKITSNDSRRNQTILGKNLERPSCMTFILILRPDTADTTERQPTHTHIPQEPPPLSSPVDTHSWIFHSCCCLFITLTWTFEMTVASDISLLCCPHIKLIADSTSLLAAIPEVSLPPAQSQSELCFIWKTTVLSPAMGSLLTLSANSETPTEVGTEWALRVTQYTQQRHQAAASNAQHSSHSTSASWQPARTFCVVFIQLVRYFLPFFHLFLQWVYQTVDQSTFIKGEKEKFNRYILLSIFTLDCQNVPRSQLLEASQGSILRLSSHSNPPIL